MGDHSNEPVFEARRDGNSLHDSAFEPNSGFMFEEPASDEEYCNMQRNIASLNGITDNQRDFQPSVDQAHNDSISSVSEQYNPDFISPFVFDQNAISPHSPSWPNGLPSTNISSHSRQADIIEGRSFSVLHQFGQITPPNDEPPKGFTAFPHKPSRASPQAQTTLSAKSERARNAANQRHAKAKMARKDSVRKDSPDAEDDGIDEDRRERYREKNRLAAAKCRAKKKVNTEDLEESARQASARNNKLRAEERELRDLFSNLRDQALAHDPSQGCGCRAIHSYNLHKAQETARGAMGVFHGMVVPSPSQGSTDSASPSTVGVSSRAQSFSGLRPQFAKHPAEAQSLAGPLAYLHNSDMLHNPSSVAVEVASSDYDFTQGLTGGDGDNFPEFMQGTSDDQQLFRS